MKFKTILSPAVPDPFEYFSLLQREKQWWQRVAFGLVLAQGILVFALLASALRPPLVIVKDRISGQPTALTKAGPAPRLTSADARSFFIQMIRLRYGWDSLTLRRDLAAYLAQSLKANRVKETAYFYENIDQKQGQAMSRIKMYTQQKRQNQILFPDDLEAIECAEREGIWHCMARVEIIQTSMRVDPENTSIPPSRKKCVVSGSLLPVRHTILTPSGLVVGLLKSFDDKIAEAS